MLYETIVRDGLDNAIFEYHLNLEELASGIVTLGCLGYTVLRFLPRTSGTILEINILRLAVKFLRILIPLATSYLV